MINIKGFWILLRFIPVISWSFNAILLGLSIDIYFLGWRGISFINLLLVILSATLLQGLIAHSYNDIVDWKSGTDVNSPGILSGGSKVILKKLLNERELSSIALWSIVIVITIAIYFVYQIGSEVLVFLFVGLWAAIAYSCSPFKLAYKPLAGEWLCAWPAMVACTVGTSYILSNGKLFYQSFIVGMMHATFSITWLMLHHIPDIEADLKARPPKMTTIAFFKQNSGWKGVRLVVSVYLILTLIFAFVGGILLKKLEIITISAFLIFFAFYFINTTRFENVEKLTLTEIRIIIITILNTVGISWILIR